MSEEKRKLVGTLREAGFSSRAIDAAWPSWWSDELAESPSGRADLRFSLARNLGLSPRELIGERVRFVWDDEVRFKNFTAGSDDGRAMLASYGVAVGRLLLEAYPSEPLSASISPETLRGAVLGSRPFVDLTGLLSMCWAIGTPVIQLEVFPMEGKFIHAMAVGVGGRYAILIGRRSQYPSPTAFALAHEIGHIAKGHLQGVPALVDVDDPASGDGRDPEEVEADRYALALLTGRQEPLITSNTDNFGARSLAAAALSVAPKHMIEPGTLALCVGYQYQNWPVAMASLRHIYSETRDVGAEINAIADSQLRWDMLTHDGATWLREVMGIAGG